MSTTPTLRAARLPVLDKTAPDYGFWLKIQKDLQRAIYIEAYETLLSHIIETRNEYNLDGGYTKLVNKYEDILYLALTLNDKYDALNINPDFASASINNGFDKAVRRAERLQKQLRCLEAVAWSGRTATTRAVYIYLAQIALRAEEDVLQVSVRQIAEHVGCSIDSAHRALRKLSDGSLPWSVEEEVSEEGPKLISLFALPKGSQTLLKMEYQAGIDARPNIKNISNALSLHSVRICTTEPHEYFGGRATPWNIYTLLRDGAGLTVAEIAQALNVNRSTITRNLKTHLVPQGLVVLQDGRYSLGSVTLDEAAESVGNTGWRQQRKERFQAEREQYAAMQERWSLVEKLLAPVDNQRDEPIECN